MPYPIGGATKYGRTTRPYDDCHKKYTDCLRGALLPKQIAICDADYTACLAKLNFIKYVKPKHSSSGVCDDYTPDEKYFRANARCFCKCIGNAKWSMWVRGCLRHAYEMMKAPKKGQKPERYYSNHEAHMICYKVGNTKHKDRPGVEQLAKCWAKCTATTTARGILKSGARAARVMHWGAK